MDTSFELSPSVSSSGSELQLGLDDDGGVFAEVDGGEIFVKTEGGRWRVATAACKGGGGGGSISVELGEEERRGGGGSIPIIVV
ncbi:hypothetical protein U1Q18_031714 [Sarracenia purpurea var. burkii]